MTISPVLLSLLSSSAARVDYIKVDGDVDIETLRQALALRPVLLHDVSYGVWLNYQDPFDDAAMTKTQTMLDLARPPWFSTGIGASAEPQRHTTEYWRGAPDDKLQPRDVCLANIVRNGKYLQSWLNIPLLLENYNYHPTNAYEYVCEPDTFNSLIDAIGCEVLLDLAHAQISAFNMGWQDPRDYLSALPLHKVREIHTNHPYNDNNKQMLDRHLPLQASDLDILRWTLDHTPHVEAITLESESPDEATLEQELALLHSVAG